MIYETKGLSLEQVDELYGIVGKAWKSKAFRPQVSFADVDHSGGAEGRKLSIAEIAAGQERKRSVASAEHAPATTEKV
jgi:SP family sugar:H+ symporter-like MFS transporter